MRPVDKRYPVSQPYGVKDPRYAAGMHTGTDFACPSGTPVHAPHGGTVVTVGNSPRDYGVYVLLRGSGGRRAWMFAHLRSADVREGQRVKRGDVIGRSGDTGNTRGAHLHAEERHAPFGYHDHKRPTAWRG